jgi:hypothetical protein
VFSHTPLSALDLHSTRVVTRLVLFAFAVGLVGCSSEDEEVKIKGSTKVSIVEGAPVAGKAAPRALVPLETNPELVATLGGVVAVGSETGTMVGTLGDEALVDLKVHPDQDGPKSTGAVELLVARDDGGLLVLADEGLFADSAGYLLSSPLSVDLVPLGVTSLDALGSESDEEIWLTASDGAHRVADGKMRRFSVQGSTHTPSHVVAVAPAQAVLVAGPKVYFVDLGEGYALEAEIELGTVTGAAHGDDGTVYLATDAGLFTRTRSGMMTLRTLAPPGEAPLAIRAVNASYGAVIAVTATDVVNLVGEAPSIIGEAGADASSTGVDATGDVWVASAEGLFHHKTGKPVSFATDVKPFFEAHCMTCHGVGKSSAPDRVLTDYDVALGLADEIVIRLRASDATTMPPPNEEVLTAADYAVVTRWVAQGALP